MESVRSYRSSYIQMKKPLIKAVLGLMFCLGLNTSNAAVIDIEATSLVGDGAIVGQGFLDENDPQAHFSLATLDVAENVNAPNSVTGAWLDLVIEITRDPNDVGDQMIAIDKDVTNLTQFSWHLFHMSIGTGVGDDFVATPGDGIDFKDNPAPREELGQFRLIPPSLQFDRDHLWFKATDDDFRPGEIADFWLGINIDESNFVNGVATITLRQHALVPEPGVLILMGIGLLSLAVRRQHKKQ